MTRKKPVNKTRLKPITFFNPETDPDPDRKPTIEQKTDPDPVRLLKVNPAGLYLLEPSGIDILTLIWIGIKIWSKLWERFGSESGIEIENCSGIFRDFICFQNFHSVDISYSNSLIDSSCVFSSTIWQSH
jgi:hypothetical protein